MAYVYCIDAQIHCMHTENDCSYTIITVPKEEKESNRSQTNFHFIEFREGVTSIWKRKALIKENVGKVRI